ncbi:MAG: LuxR C-terminal-related transcriptional regulator [Suilimivivens sp.]
MINQRLLSKCYEECFQYYEVVCFKTYPYEYQIILLKLAFFHKVNKELLVQVFGYSEKESLGILHELSGAFGALIFRGEDEYEIEDFLRLFLQKRQTAYLGVGEMNSLYSAAFDYYYNKGEWLEAIKYADLNGDKQGMVKCLHAVCENNVLYAGYSELEAYMRSIPQSYITNDPALYYAYAYMEALCGNKEGAEYYVHQVEKYLKELSEETEEYRQFKMIYGLMQIGLPYKSAEELENQLKYLESQTDYPRYKLSISGGLPSVLHGGRDFCIYMKRDQKSIHEICKRLSFVLQENYDGFEETGLGEIAYEKGDFQDAVTWLSKGAGKAVKGGETAFVANMLLVKIMYHRNQQEQAVHIMKSLEKTLEQKNNTYSRKNLEAFNVYMNMQMGQVEPVKDWVEHRAPSEYDFFDVLDRYCYLIKIYAYIMLDKIESALLILHRILEYSREYNRIYDELNMRILEMIIDYRHGDTAWQKKMEELLTETEGYGMVRIYADKGSLIYPILKKYEEIRKNSDSRLDLKYYKKIMEQTKKETLLYPSFLVWHKEHEELSVQEMDILRLLCQGMRNAEIAKQLFLSENTVKYHLKKVYQKLQAGSRSEAIAIARDLNLV